MKTIKSIMSYVIPIVVAVALVLVINNFVMTPIRVDGNSMQPNLENQQLGVAVKPTAINHNSVIIFDANGEDPSVHKHTDYVKRVIGLPGDTVESKNGNIYVNHKKIYQGYIGKYQRTTGTGNWTLHSLSKSWPRDNGVTVVPKGKYFVLGDHRSISMDGRYWGFVPKNKIVGVMKVLPFSKNATLVNASKQ
ncbi:signal peptidase I [Lentilactobacillus sp. Marseille-Q4993]|uniref:signal peptidase I n=1 Tax=Lentilactobacillus sp. Marseille-Q4993 TaxID=3039492 RepID=UPI0024BC54BE|nr:signal peptidase I [Lentilactobacillus sp. Marseille-Q4993]